METNMNHIQCIPTRILFGTRRLNNLHTQTMPGKKALIIISNGKSTRSNGYLARTEGFIAASANLASDMNTREAICNIAEYLPCAVKDGSDLDSQQTAYKCLMKILCRFSQNHIDKNLV